MADLNALTEAACDELTLEHILIGVTAKPLEDPHIEEENKVEAAATGSKKKRQTKKAAKDEKKINTILKTESEEKPVAASIDSENPLKLNFNMLVAMERREAILAFAERKFTSGNNNSDELKLIDVVKAMATLDRNSQSFYAHLSP